MQAILQKCNQDDLFSLDEILDSYLSPTNDERRKKLIRKSKSCSQSKNELISLLDKQIRYYGSSDIAYLYRCIISNDGGVSASELVTDVCEKLKVKIKHVGTIESKLERLVIATVDKELLAKSPAELKEELAKLGVGNPDIDSIIKGTKSNGSSLLASLAIKVAPETTTAIIQTIVMGLITKLIGKEAAKKLVETVLTKVPQNALGPIIWVISAVWTTYDLQGPAYRKTVPLALLLGVIALRDGEET